MSAARDVLVGTSCSSSGGGGGGGGEDDDDEKAVAQLRVVHSLQSSRPPPESHHQSYTQQQARAAKQIRMAHGGASPRGSEAGGECPLPHQVKSSHQPATTIDYPWMRPCTSIYIL